MRSANWASTIRPNTRISVMSARSACLVAAPLAMLTVGLSAQTSPDIDLLLARVGQRIAEYYKRAQNVICTEKTMVQPVGHDYAPAAFARMTDSHLPAEPHPTS